MTITNDDGDVRTIELRMTPMEALLALESFSIGAATMLAYENRGRRQMNAIVAMSDRLVAQTGLSRRGAEMLADGASGIFVVVDMIARPDTRSVVLRLDRERFGRRLDRIEAIVDGQPVFLAKIEATTEDREKASVGDHWDRQKQELANNVAVFDDLAAEFVSLLRSQADVGVEFSVETTITCEIPRPLVGRNEDALRDVLEKTLDAAFDAIGGETHFVEMTHDIWSDCPLVAVEMRAVVPFVVRDEANERVANVVATLEQAKRLSKAAGAPSL